MKISTDIPNRVFRHISRGSFANRHGVVFQAEDYCSLSAAITIYKKSEVGELAIEFFGEKKVFANELLIKTVRDLYTIDKDFLHRLFNNGKAQLVCQVNLHYTYFLAYRIVCGKMIAENDWLTKHEVKVKFENYEQLIEYTKHYYQLIDMCCKN